MTGSSGAPKRNLFGWAGRSDVERVRRYTEWSLFSMLWLFLAFYGIPVLQDVGSLPLVGATLVVYALLGVVGIRSTRLALDRWPEAGMPWDDARVQTLMVTVAAATAWGLVVAPDDRIGYPMLLAMVMGWGFGGFRSNAVLIAAVVLSGAIGWLLSGELALGLVAAGFTTFMVFTMQSSLWMLGVVLELDRARRVQADLAVAQERLRFAADVHDVMGRHLSVIAVQSELAAALVAKGDDRAGERIRQVRASAHDALREARELARGYRPLDLAQELEGAVSLLASAGVRAEVDVAAVAGGVPAALHDPVARVVREAITNVIRHSTATSTRIAWDGTTLTIANDRPCAVGPDGQSSGLASLAQSAERLGGTLVHGVVPGTDGEEFVLTLTLPL